MGYTFDAVVGRFRDSAGRFVSESAVRSVVDQIADAASSRMAAASERLLAGELSLASWQAEQMALIRTSHVAATVIAHGGEGSMTFSRWGSAGADIKAQYVYARSFADDIASGRQPLNRTIVSRSEMYGQHARVAYETIRGEAAVARGEDEARNTLHANESCSQCRSLAARGWMPASEMPAVGSRTCLSRCRCTISRRRHPASVAA